MRFIIPTGCDSLDRLLGGGLPPEKIILLYGEAETGKTSLATQCAVNSARRDYKTIFVDSDNAFSPKRLAQIARNDFEKVSTFIIIIKPVTFQEQATVIDQLDRYLTEKFGLIIVDTVTSLYRVDLGNMKETFMLNRELNRQVGTLAQVAKTHKTPVLITSQVRSVLSHEKEATIEPVATRVLKFWSDVVISLKSTDQRNIIKATIEKPVKDTKKLGCYLIIGSRGIRSYGRGHFLPINNEE